MELLQTLFALLVTLGILVAVHEAGHFIVARACGVRVLRFSVGMGPVLFSRRDRRGTEFALSAFPIGGYVQMLDARVMSTAPCDYQESFDHKPPMQRIAIALGGPLANFLLAILVYWLVFVTGTSGIAPVTGETPPDTPAAWAGLGANQEILAIDGRPTPTWQAVNLALVERLGESGVIRIKARELAGYRPDPRLYELPVKRWLASVDDPDTLGALGLVPGLPAVAGSVLAGEPAALAGMQAGDRILTVNDAAIANWGDWVQAVRAAPGRALPVELERNGRQRRLTVTPALREAGGELIGYVGTGPLYRTTRLPGLLALRQAFLKTGSMTALTLDILGKMITGRVSAGNLSGPITIATVAGASAASGLETFLTFLAFLSVGLGVLNLLPIPLLDGGHVMYYLVEAVRGAPVPEWVQAIGLRIGLFLISGMMLLALYNDLTRLLASQI